MSPTPAPMTIAIAGFQHETNTFGATRAGYDDFVMADSWPGLLIGDEVLPGVHGTTLPLAGFVAAAKQDRAIDLHPILWGSAEPSAQVTDDAFDRISAMIIAGLRDAGPVDGVYLDLHGAMVTESHDDGEGELLRRVRAETGDDIPVSISLDSHANISPAMVEQVDAISIFRSYPHLDMAETGGRAFHALRPLLTGTRRGMALRQVPFLIPLPDQYSEAGPLKLFYDHLKAADQFSQGPETLSETRWLDFATGFPAADHAFTGPAIIAQAATQDAAETEADQALAALLALEPALAPSLVPARDAVARAISADHPVILADVQDNPGAGSTSDTTGLLHELMAQNARGVVVAMLNDPDVAALAHQNGVGATITAELGGKAWPDSPPVAGSFDVLALSDGHFPFTGEMYAGCVADAGPCAVLRPKGHDIQVVISSKRCQALDQAVFTHIGVNLAEALIIVVKSTVHFRADFSPLSDEIIHAVAPGRTPCGLTTAGFTHLRPGLRLGPMGPVFSAGCRTP